LIAIHRTTYVIDLALTGARNEKVGAYSQTAGCTDRHIFFAWLMDLFLLEVAGRREAIGHDDSAVLLMETCTPQIGHQADRHAPQRKLSSAHYCPIPRTMCNRCNYGGFGFSPQE
jgi:hypothetical protein